MAAVRRKPRKIVNVQVMGRGLSFDIDEVFSADAEAAVRKAIEKKCQGDTLPALDSLEKAVRTSMSNFLWDKTKTRPLIIPVVLEA